MAPPRRKKSFVGGEESGLSGTAAVDAEEYSGVPLDVSGSGAHPQGPRRRLIYTCRRDLSGRKSGG